MTYGGFLSGILESNENQAIPPVVDFIFGVDTTLPGSPSTDFILPLTNGVTYDFTVFWGDGNSDVVNSSAISSISHTYASGGEYEIQIAGTAPEIIFGGATDVTKVTSIKDWGDDPWSNVASMFDGAVNLSGYSAVDPPNLAVSADSFLNMFRNCAMLQANVSNWNTSNVLNMSGMFNGASVFDSDLSGWITTQVTDMSYMFNDALLFNGNVTTWDTSSCTDMSFMFTNCAEFSWNPSLWNTAAVTNMSQMFRNAVKFSGSLANWNTGLVTNMDYMFANTSSTINSYGVNLWNVTSLTSAIGFMTDHNMAVTTYNSIINNWGPQAVQSNVTVDFGTSQFSGLALTNYDRLDITFNWTIIDGGIITMTMIAGGSSSHQGYAIGSFGSFNPTNIGGFTIREMSFDSSLFVFPITYNNAFVLRTQGTQPWDYWNRIVITHSSGSPSYTVYQNALNYQGTINGHTTQIQNNTAVRLTPGEQYDVQIIK
jgi:surface protein